MVIAVVAITSGYLLWAALRPRPIVALVRTDGTSTGIAAMIGAGFDRASRDFRIDAREVVVLADMEQRIRELASGDVDLIVGDLDFSPFLWSVAADYTDTWFVVLGWSFDTGPNFAVTEFDDAGLAYLAGVAAALTTETDIVGVVVGMQNPLMESFVSGYEAGVASVDRHIAVLVDFVSARLVPDDVHGWRWDAFARPDAAYEAARHMYAQGADVVFSAAGSSGYGSIEAAADHSDETGTQVWAIGVDYDEGFLSTDGTGQYVLTSMVKRYDEATYRAIEAYLDGTLEPTMRFGFDNGGVTYSTYGGHVDGIAPALDRTAEALAAGDIAIPWVAVTQPTWHREPDDSIEVTFDGAACRVSRPPRVAPDETLNVIARNATSDPVLFTIGYAPTGVTLADLTASGFDELFPGFAWNVAPGSSYDLRATMVGDPLGGVLFGCFPDEEALFTTDVFPVLEG